MCVCVCVCVCIYSIVYRHTNFEEIPQAVSWLPEGKRILM